VQPASRCSGEQAERKKVPLSVLTTSTLARLQQAQPDSHFDERRFRMNVIVKANQSGFVENGWIGHEIAAGGLTAVVPQAMEI
jgi:uncharacterized protein YcbX